MDTGSTMASGKANMEAQERVAIVVVEEVQNGKFYNAIGEKMQGEYHGEYFENGVWTGKFNPSKLHDKKTALEVGPDGKHFYWSKKLFSGWIDGYEYQNGLKTGMYKKPV